MDKIQEALQNIEIILNERASFKTGNEAKIAYSSFEIIKAKCLKEDKEENKEYVNSL